MRYIEAVEAITIELEADDSDDPVRAGIRLALLPWREHGDTDATWDKAALCVLAAEELLRPYVPDTTAPCDLPVAGDVLVAAAVVRLVRALTVRLEHTGDKDVRPLPERLARHAAARQLDQAVALLA